MRKTVRTLTTVLVLLYSTGAFAFHTAPVEVYILEGARWGKPQVELAIEEANSILQKCGVSAELQLQIKIINGLEQNGSVSLISDLNPEFRLNELALHETVQTNSLQNIKMFFVREIKNLPGVLGISRRQELHAGEIYENAVYISNQLGTGHAGHTIAHELGHVLLNAGHYFLDPTPNIMQSRPSSQNDEFDNSQCSIMASSPILIETLKFASSAQNSTPTEL